MREPDIHLSISRLKALLAGGLIVTGICLSLPGCSSTQQTTAQNDLTTALQIMKLAGCDTAVLSAAAAPVISVTVDANGQKIAQAVAQTGQAVCTAPAPALVSPVGTTLGTPTP